MIIRRNIDRPNEYIPSLTEYFALHTENKRDKFSIIVGIYFCESYSHACIVLIGSDTLFFGHYQHQLKYVRLLDSFV